MGRVLNVKLLLDTKTFDREMNRAQNKIVAFGNKLESIGTNLTTRLSLPLGLLGGAAIKAAGDMQQLRLALNAITGNAEEAGKEFDRLRKVALLPGIDLEQAIAGSIRLQSVGFSADEAAFSLAQLSKAVTLAGGSSQDLEEVTRQLTQIIGKGKLLSEDIKVILSRVPALGLALRDAFGTTSIEKIRESGISVQEFTSKLITAISQNEKFQAVQGGINNALVNFQSAIRQSLGALGEEIIKTTKLDEVLSVLADTVQSAIQGFKNLSPGVKQAIVVTGLLATALGPLLVGLGALIKLLPLIRTGLASIGLVGGGVIAATTAMTFAFFKLVDQLGGVEEALAFVQAKFTATVAGIKETVARTLQTIASAVPGGGTNIRLRTDAQNAGKTVGEVYRSAFEESLRQSAFGSGRKRAESELTFNPDFSNLLSVQTAPVDADGGKRKRPGLAELPRLTGSAFGELAEQVDFANIKLLESTALQDSAAESLERVRLGAAAWNEQIAAGIPLALEQAVILEQTNEKLAQQQQRFQEIAGFVTGEVNNAFQGFFETLIGGGSNAFKAFTNALKRLIVQLASALATALALTAVFSLLTGGAGAAKGLLGLKGGGSLFGGILKNLLPFAEGGLVTAPTAALIGEGPGTSRANPEVVAPLDKLQGMLGGGVQKVQVEVIGRLSGADLLLVTEREKLRRQG